MRLWEPCVAARESPKQTLSIFSYEGGSLKALETNEFVNIINGDLMSVNELFRLLPRAVKLAKLGRNKQRRAPQDGSGFAGKPDEHPMSFWEREPLPTSLRMVANESKKIRRERV